MLISTFLDRAIKRCQNLTRRETSLLVVCVFFLVVFINGVSTVPHEDYLRLSQNPFTTRTDIFYENYFQESVLLPVTAFYLGLNSRLSYALFCLFILVVAYLLFVCLTYKCYDNTTSLILITILITNPITTVLFSWLGTPDGVTFALTIPFLFVSSPLLLFFLAVLGTMNHMAFIIAASEILILRSISGDRVGKINIAAAIFGGVIGYVLVRVFLLSNNIILRSSRVMYIFSMNLMTWIQLNLSDFPTNILSLFNIQWLIIPICLIMFFKFDKKYYSAWFAFILLNYGITFFTLDTTRVFIVMSWGILLQCIFHSYKLSRQSDQEPSFQRQYLYSLIVIGIASIISHRYYSWEGVSHNTTPVNEFIKQFMSK